MYKRQVLEAAVLHGGPVVDGGGMQERICAESGYKLLDGLKGVEDAGIGGCGEGEAFTVGEDDVALGLHLVGHLGGGVRGTEGVTIYRVRNRRAVAGDEDVDRRGGVDGDLSLIHI